MAKGQRTSKCSRLGSGLSPRESHSHGRAEAPNVITIQLGLTLTATFPPLPSSLRRQGEVVLCVEKNKAVLGEDGVCEGAREGLSAKTDEGVGTGLVIRLMHCGMCELCQHKSLQAWKFNLKN